MSELRMYGQKAPRVHPRESDPEKCHVQQNQRDEVNINTIVKRFTEKGTPLPGTQTPIRFDDVSEAVELQRAYEIADEADSRFNALPANIRDAVGNDPVRLLQALSNPKEAEGLQALGLELGIPDPTQEENSSPPKPDAPASTEGGRPPAESQDQSPT